MQTIFFTNIEQTPGMRGKYGLCQCSEPGHRNRRIRRSSNAPLNVFPLRSLRGRCRLRQMRCNYIRAVGATLLTYVSVSSVTTGRDTAIYVFVQCECASKKTPLKNVAVSTADLITPHPSPKVTPSPQATQGKAKMGRSVTAPMNNE